MEEIVLLNAGGECDQFFILYKQETQQSAMT